MSDEHDQQQAASDKLTAERLISAYKINIARKIKAGDVGLSRELDYLQEQEKKAGTSEPAFESPADEVGVPERLRVRRQYTLTPEALRQRQEAAKQPKPGLIGNRNGWKHGKFAQGFIQNKIRPCLSTCPQYPCDLVEDGTTHPGGDCLDKAEVIQSFRAILDAVQKKEFGDFQELAALTIAQSIQTVHMLLEDIQRDGTMVKSEKIDKDGRVIGHDIKLHPSLLALPKLIADLGLTPQEFMITPRQIAKQGAEDDGIKSIADLMSKVGASMKQKQGGRPNVDDDGDE